ncbi:3-hydroxyacyl-CoA dehydrogenase family protein [Geoglobus ahangari]
MRALVVGAGLMGQGIAVEVSKGVEEVVLCDVSEDALERARRGIELSLKTLEKHGMADRSVLNRIMFTTRIGDGDAADIAFEAVPEDVELKGRVLREIEAVVGENAPVCTNTSIIRVSDLAGFLERKERFLGVHWMNPPHVMPLVEVVTSRYTDEGVAGRVAEFLRGIGKRVVVCREQSAVNRFSAAVLAEAERMMESDGMSFEEIDTVWRYHLGILYTLFGPLGNLDYVGLDTILLVSKYLSSTGERVAIPDWLVEKVKRGELGIKTGRGIYSYDRDHSEMLVERIEKILGMLRFLRTLEG